MPGLSESRPVVFVVDDDPAMCTAIESLLRSVRLEVVSFRTSAEFLARRRSDTLSCLVLDVDLPGVSGLDLQAELRAREPSLPVVFITGHGDIPMSVRAIKAGAIEFLPKPFRDEDLLAAIEQALATAKLARVELAEDAELQSRYESLTRREREVMTLVVSGLLNKQIAAELGISEVTVKIHRGQAMRKMSAGSVAQLVRMAVRLDIATSES
ncbi:MAG: nodW [Myxococcaceae bacterium]|nr:nodW [Myxococcaceae bacterium]